MFWKILSKTTTKKSKIRRLRKYSLWGLRIILVCVLIDFGYILGLMPNWDLYSVGPIQKSRFIELYEYEQKINREWPVLRWEPVPLSSIPDYVIQAFIVAEDSRFYQHSGIDQEALKQALDYDLSKGRFVYGGSTISQQTVKNLFLTPSRIPLRKWHEIILTFAMERHLSKRRIMELYLNIVEFGRGIFGVQAAAKAYWGKSVSDLAKEEAVELAATLPAPIYHNPATRTEFFLKHKKKILKNLGMSE